MLAFFGALVPVLASLWVGAGTLCDLSAQSHKARVAERIWAKYNLDRTAIEDGDPRLGEKNKALTDRCIMLLEANRLDPMIGTIKALNRSVMPAPPSPKEFHITLGIYAFWVYPRLQKWIIEHQVLDNA